MAMRATFIIFSPFTRSHRTERGIQYDVKMNSCLLQSEKNNNKRYYAVEQFVNETK